MNKKGFTLIELLAVIVILAIIALIATPIILGIINDARDSAKKRSAELVYTGVQYAYTTSLYQTTDGEIVVTPTLETISKNLKLENVQDKNIVTTTTKITITTDDGVSCEVTKEADDDFAVACEGYLDKKSVSTGQKIS